MSSPSVALVAAVFVAIMHLAMILCEEPVLDDRFGDSYRAYRAGVSRWVIRFPRDR